ncbi:hypothetical protein [Mucilaginibacter sp.]
MHHLLIDILHVFVVAAMLFFIVMCTLASTGSFDNWGKRYKTKRLVKVRNIRNDYPNAA